MTDRVEHQPDYLELHYFSGTGNTYRVTEWIADSARSRGIPVALKPIDTRVAGEEPPVPAGRRMLGILTPTHGFTAPWNVVAYAARVPGVRGADVFTVATRAGWYVGPLLLPGLEGTATWLLGVVLALRGGRLVGVNAIDMPSNWTAVHWGMNAAHVTAIVTRAHAKTRLLAEDILGGHRRLGGWLSLAIGLLLVPASLGYTLFARRLLGKFFFADERCTSCGLCAASCPLDSVRMAGGSPKRPYWTFGCESCMRCMNICPERAIQASWLGAAAASYFMLAAYGAMLAVLPKLIGSLANPVASVAAPVVLAIAMALAYRVVWALGRSSMIASLRGHLTPTRLYRRYREPETNLRDI